MPYTPITVLPPAPSKVADPVNFVNKAALFLQALPAFRDQHNTLLAYLNTKYPNKWNCGVIGDTNPTLPVNPVLIVPTGTGVDYVSAVDNLYADLVTTSVVSNKVGAYIDVVATKQGLVSADNLRSTVPSLTTPPSRTQALAAFNTTAAAFTNSTITSFDNLTTNLGVVNNCFIDEDFGSIIDGTISETIDAGLITDSTITN